MAENSAPVLSFEQQCNDQGTPDEYPYIETTLARALRARLELAHKLRRIAIVSGPPGIGKTTAFRAFAAEHPGEVVIVKVEAASNQKGRTPVAVLQLLAEALLGGASLAQGYLPNTSSQQVMRQFVCNHVSRSYCERLTIIFDEAQFLSRAAIEMLRFWNDPDQDAMPFPIGLVFVGNHEFSLEQDARGRSVISDAVRSRALRPIAFERADLTREDLSAFITSRGVNDSEAIRELLDFIERTRAPRDLRWIGDQLYFCQLHAGDSPISQAIVRKVLTGR